MFRVGVDLGGTNIAVGVVDDNYNIIGRGKMKTNAPRDAKAIFDDVATAVKMAVADANLTLCDIASIGIGTPGSVNKASGVIDYANNLDFNHVPAKDMLAEALDMDKIYIEMMPTVRLSARLLPVQVRVRAALLQSLSVQVSAAV